MLKPSDSSFGLHSPDLAVNTNEEKELETLIRRLQEDHSLPEGNLYLDPDIIDLTMIPPPITPEEDGMKFPTTLNEPPTPFADRDSLENELAAIQKNSASIYHSSNQSDLGELKELSSSVQRNDAFDSSNINETDYLIPPMPTHDDWSTASKNITKSLTKVKRRWVADEKRKYLSDNPEMNQFSSVVSASSTVSNKGTILPQLPISSFNDDLSAYIIPPPPLNVGNVTANDGMAILQKLYAAREGISQVLNSFQPLMFQLYMFQFTIRKK